MDKPVNECTMTELYDAICDDKIFRAKCIAKCIAFKTQKSKQEILNAIIKDINAELYEDGYDHDLYKTIDYLKTLDTINCPFFDFILLLAHILPIISIDYYL